MTAGDDDTAITVWTIALENSIEVKEACAGLRDSLSRFARKPMQSVPIAYPPRCHSASSQYAQPVLGPTIGITRRFAGAASS